MDSKEWQRTLQKSKFAAFRAVILKAGFMLSRDQMAEAFRLADIAGESLAVDVIIHGAQMTVERAALHLKDIDSDVFGWGAK